MARATATCVCSECGKEFTVTAYRRNLTEANSFVAWAEGGGITLCDDCYKDEQRAIKQAVLNTYSRRIPELTGTEKQVAWANDLRLESVKKADEFIRRSLDKANSEHIDLAKAYITWLIETKTESCFWIDNRGCFVFNIPAAKEFGKSYAE